MKDLSGEEWTSVQALFDELVDLKPYERDKRLRRSTLAPGLLAHVTSLLNAASTDGIFEMAAPDLSPP
uniref:hypothetical protein n=1 Tax=Sphingomonas sp. ERG5 TaxID=1381597 RepID=UPI00054C4F0F